MLSLPVQGNKSSTLLDQYMQLSALLTRLLGELFS
jgi:hypothetical protein